MDRPKIVVTGGAGFIGSHMADALVGQGDVVVVDHLKAGKRANLDRAVKAGATLRKVDLLSGELGRTLRGADVVYHFAANPDVRMGRAGAKPLVEQNIIATYRVLEACRAAKVPRIVFTSTSTVYGEATVVPTPEDYAPLEPISVYGASKLADEALLSAYAHTFGIQAVIFRLANVVGSRSGHGVVVDFVRKLAGDPSRLQILGSDPGTAKSYVDIEDTVAGIAAGVRAAEGPVTVFNLGSEDAITVRALADAVCQEMGLSGVEYEWTGGSGGGRGWAGDVRVMQLAIERLRATGWRPRRSSEAAVRAAAKAASTSIRWSILRALGPSQGRRACDGRSNRPSPIDVAGGDPSGKPKPKTEAEWHRWFAVRLFNSTWKLLLKDRKTRADKDVMVLMAHASRYHWGVVGGPKEAAIGEWQISHVYAVLGRPEPALYHAERSLEICESDKVGDFPLAYAYEALARAFALAGKTRLRDACMKLARAAGERIEEDDDRDLFFRDLRTVPRSRRR